MDIGAVVHMLGMNKSKVISSGIRLLPIKYGTVAARKLIQPQLHFFAAVKYNGIQRS